MKTAKKNVKISVVVWGLAYTDDFLEISFPTWFAAGNIPHIAKTVNLECYFYCDTHAKKKILNSRLAKKLKYFCKVHFDDKCVMNSDKIDKQEDAYGILVQSHQLFITNCLVNDILIFINPDIIMSRNYLKNALYLLDQNTDAVYTHYFRVSKEKVYKLMKDKLKDRDKIEIAENRLTKIALEYMHPVNDNTFWIKNNFGFSSWHHCELANHSGFYSSMFHPHPLVVRLCNKVYSLTSTIDHHFVMDATRGENYIQTLQGKDGFHLEVSSNKYNPFKNDPYEVVLLEPSIASTFSWLFTWTRNHHRLLAKQFSFFQLKSIKRLNKNSVNMIKARAKLDKRISEILQNYDKTIELFVNIENADKFRILQNQNKKVKICAKRYFEEMLIEAFSDINNKYNSELILITLKKVFIAWMAEINISIDLRKKYFYWLKQVYSENSEANTKVSIRKIKLYLLPEKTLFGKFCYLFSKLQFFDKIILGA